jgi:AAHS family benzoate transporter-like MFS transporter
MAGPMNVAGGRGSINSNQWIAESAFSSFHLLVFVLGFAVFIFDGYDLIVYSAAVPLLMKEFRIGPAYIGAIASYVLIGAAVGALAFGALADKIGRKTTVILCTCLFSVCMGLTAITHGPLSFAILRFLTGLGIGGTMPNVIAIAAEYAPARSRTFMAGMVTAGYPVGGMAAALLSKWLFPTLGWRGVFGAGIVPLLLIFFYVKYLPESPVHLVKRNRLESLRGILRRVRPSQPLAADAELQVDTTAAGKAPIKAIFQNGRAYSTIVLWVMFFMHWYLTYGFIVWMPKLMMTAGFSLGSGLFFLLTQQTLALVGNFVLCYLGDRLGPKPVMVGAFLVCFVSIGLVPYTHSFALLTFLIGLSGFGYSGAQGVENSYVGNYYPPSMRSTGVGMVFAVGRTGAIFGPMLAGLMMSFHFSYNNTLLVIALPGVIAAVCVLLVPNKHDFALQQQQQRAAAAAGRMGSK